MAVKQKQDADAGFVDTVVSRAKAVVERPVHDDPTTDKVIKGS